jgi:hypothetical protein
MRLCNRHKTAASVSLTGAALLSGTFVRFLVRTMPRSRARFGQSALPRRTPDSQHQVSASRDPRVRSKRLACFPVHGPAAVQARSASGCLVCGSGKSNAASPIATGLTPAASVLLALRVGCAVRPNPSLKLTRYGRLCKPGPRRYAHSLEPGLQSLPPRSA